MSSGLGRMFRRIFGNLDAERLQRLVRQGRTIELGLLRGVPNVVQINLGHGTEFWIVPNGEIRPASDPPALEGGRLVLQGGQPVRSGDVLRKRGFVWKRVPTRI
jgi:hypothetical protein